MKFFLSILVSFFSFVPVSAQPALSPEQEALKEKLVQLVLKFDPVEWEQTKIELRNKTFPVYPLTFEAIQEAQFRFEFVDEIDDPEKEEQLQVHAYLMRSFMEELGKLRLQQDYQRLGLILRTYKPRVPDADKLIFRLDENRRVRAIAYSGKYKKKQLPAKNEKALINLLQKQNFQTYETIELMVNPYKKEQRFSLKRKWKRFKRLFERKPPGPYYKYKGRYYRHYE
jgi:hypothetical protein